jgi:myo-inositol-1(or 4)-monophosphatase
MQVTDVAATVLLELATSAAREAGSLLRQRFGGPARNVATKSTPTDLVSDADREAEQIIIKGISGDRPEDGFLAEEGGGRESSTGIRWIVDPLDGTVNFLYGIPVWAVSIAAEDAQGVVVGTVFNPTNDELFSAIRGKGAELNGRPIGVSQEIELSRALIGTGFAYDVRVREVQAAVVSRVLPAVRDIRRSGSAALDLCSLACGRLDGFYEAWMGPWDRAAGVLIASEAGATVTDLPPPFGNQTGVVGANSELHSQLRELVMGGNTWT